MKILFNFEPPATDEEIRAGSQAIEDVAKMRAMERFGS